MRQKHVPLPSLSRFLPTIDPSLSKPATRAGTISHLSYPFLRSKSFFLLPLLTSSGKFNSALTISTSFEKGTSPMIMLCSSIPSDHTVAGRA